MKFSEWLRCWLTLKPHFTIGYPGRPYLHRWYVVPRNRWLNVYLHKFVRDDDDRALHDHPWSSLSIVLRGTYREITDDGARVYHAGSVIRRSAEHRHRIELVTPSVWTLFITGPKARDWGFWCPRGFVPWQEFVATEDPGQIGRGCGEP